MNGFYPHIGGDLPPRQLETRTSSAGKAIAGFAKTVVGTAALTALAAVMIMLYVSPLGSGELPYFFVFALVGSTFAVAAAGLVIGLPLTWVLASNRLEGPWTYPTVGFAVGATIVMLFYSLVFASDPELIIAQFGPLVLVGGLPGGVYGALWWHFHRRHVRAN